MKLVLLVMFFSLIVLSSSTVMAGVDTVSVSAWTLSFDASIGGLNDSLATFGVRSDATPGYDSLYDVPEPPTPPEAYIEAYFPHSGGNWPVFFPKYATDISTPNFPTWLLTVATSLGSGTVTLAWDTSSINKLPSWYEIMMKDSGNGNIIRLRHQPSYMFQYSAVRYFSIWIVYDTTVASVMPGWNLVSIPKNVTDSSKIQIFPTAVSSAFAYEGNYVIQNFLEPGKGYWLKFNSSQVIGFTGSAFSLLSIPVKLGWNLIGTVDHNIPAPTGGIITSSFFGYSGNYVIADTLRVGKGYWVKTSSPGNIVIGNNQSLPKSHGTDRLPDKKIAFTITDNNHSTQTLYLLPTTVKELSASLYEMPPVPPAGSFDARFVSQRFVESYDAKDFETHDCTIQIQSSNYPIVVTPDIHDQDIVRAEASVDGGTWHQFPVTLESAGEQVLYVRIISAVNQPRSFQLEQNYPNPFNPSSVIRYMLPEQSHVRIILFDVLGKDVAVLGDGLEPAGLHQVVVNENALHLTSGMYFYRFRGTGILTGRTFGDTKKLILMK